MNCTGVSFDDMIKKQKERLSVIRKAKVAGNFSDRVMIFLERSLCDSPMNTDEKTC